MGSLASSKMKDGRTEIDSNVVERAIRPIAFGREHHLFAGSDSGGDHCAIIASLIETGKINSVDPQAICTMWSPKSSHDTTSPNGLCINVHSGTHTLGGASEAGPAALACARARSRRGRRGPCCPAS